MVPTHREVLRYARSSGPQERDVKAWMDHCQQFCREKGLDFGADLYQTMMGFWETGEWPEERLSAQVAVDSLAELLRERIDQVISFCTANPGEDWHRRKEMGDIAFSYVLLVRIRHWQISHRQ